MSNSVLALLVALASVLSFAVPAMIEALRSDGSHVTVSNPVFEREEVILAATNVGETGGIVRRAELTSDLLGGQAGLELRSAAEAFVPPGSSRVGFRIAIMRNALDTAILLVRVSSLTVAQREDVVGRLTVWSEQADGSTTGQTFAMRRIDLLNLLEAHRQRCEAGRPMRREEGCDSLDDLVRATNIRVHRTLKRLQGIAGVR